MCRFHCTAQTKPVGMNYNIANRVEDLQRKSKISGYTFISGGSRASALHIRVRIYIQCGAYAERQGDENVTAKSTNVCVCAGEFWLLFINHVAYMRTCSESGFSSGQRRHRHRKRRGKSSDSLILNGDELL